MIRKSFKLALLISFVAAALGAARTSEAACWDIGVCEECRWQPYRQLFNCIFSQQWCSCEPDEDDACIEYGDCTHWP